MSLIVRLYPQYPNFSIHRRSVSTGAHEEGLAFLHTSTRAAEYLDSLVALLVLVLTECCELVFG